MCSSACSIQNGARNLQQVGKYDLINAAVLEIFHRHTPFKRVFEVPSGQIMLDAVGVGREMEYIVVCAGRREGGRGAERGGGGEKRIRNSGKKLQVEKRP